jgi:hypothetical protein
MSLKFVLFVFTESYNDTNARIELLCCLFSVASDHWICVWCFLDSLLRKSTKQNMHQKVCQVTFVLIG